MGGGQAALGWKQSERERQGRIGVGERRVEGQGSRASALAYAERRTNMHTTPTLR